MGQRPLALRSSAVIQLPKHKFQAAKPWDLATAASGMTWWTSSKIRQKEELPDHPGHFAREEAECPEGDNCACKMEKVRGSFYLGHA